MLIETESNVVASAGLLKTSSFQIATSAHAFRILSSGLYSDKIGAVLREIGCNAMDAHIAEGIPNTPFEVHLPSRLTSKFYIRDFGPGLSPDEILSLYTTYFSSSKQRSNEFTGAFGLGSKSPFSYTDNFTIVSVHGGRKCTYTAYVDQVGGPSVSPIHEEDASSDWPHGMMISLPVKQQDYNEFQQKAQQIFSWFRVIPQMVNSEQISPRKYSVETDDFGIPAELGVSGVNVVMGNVRYPVPWAECQTSQVWAKHVHPVLRIPIGSIDVAASREQLEFTPKTRAAIVSSLDTVFKHLVEELAEQFKRLDTTTLAGMREANLWLRPLASKWTGGQLKQFLVRGGISDDAVDEVSELMSSNPNLRVPKDFVGTIKCYTVNGKGHLQLDERNFVDTWYRSLPSNLGSPGSIVLLGKAKYLKDRLRSALSTQGYRYLYIVSEDDTEAEQIAKQWYDFPTVRAEDLELPAGWVAPAKRPKGPRRKASDDALVKMALFNTDGSCRYDSSYPLDQVLPEQKFFLRPTCAWGKYSYYFGGSRGSHHGFKEQAGHLARIAQFVPEMPKGFGIIGTGDVKRYKLETDLGWKFIGDVADILTAAAVRDQVNVTKLGELGLVDTNGYCYQCNTPLLFLGSHAKHSSPFWRALRLRLPMSRVVIDAARLASSGYSVSSAKPIPAEVYNDALDVFGSRSDRVDVVEQKDQSLTLYPTMQAVLGHGFPNALVQTNFELAADVVARLIEADEKHLPSTIDLLAA